MHARVAALRTIGAVLLLLLALTGTSGTARAIGKDSSTASPPPHETRLQRIAAELANDLNAAVDDEPTAILPDTTAPEADDATAEMPARDNEATAEFEASYDPNDTNAVTVNMSNEDKTAEMPTANIIMPIMVSIRVKPSLSATFFLILLQG